MREVKWNVRIGLVVFLLFCSNIFSEAQRFSIGKSGSFAKINSLFIYEVKSIDEFIQRFNNDDHSYLRKIYAVKNKPFSIERPDLIFSLFNFENTSMMADTATIAGFINEIANTVSPGFLNFLDSNWYAEAQTVVWLGKKKYLLPVTFRIKAQDDWAEWLIAGVGEMKEFKDASGIKPKTETNLNTPTYLPTSSNATGFIELTDVFSDRVDYSLFFDPQYMKSTSGQRFLSQLKKNEVQFLYTNKITYHFLHIKNWAFEVECFQRNSMNSGWLINKLYRADSAKKEQIISQIKHWN